MKHWIQTASGAAFDLLDPQPDMVRIEDIAHSLAHLCRYTGHCRRVYTVAEHSLIVASLLPTPELRLQGLMHDATEAFVGDVASPLKALLPEYRAVEDRVWKAIADRFALPHDLDPAVKHADLVALMSEKKVLMGPSPMAWTINIKPDVGACLRIEGGTYSSWTKEKFLSAFRALLTENVAVA